MPDHRAGTVLVVGSLNVDLIMRTPRLPRRGETVTGASFHTAPGGKGANQAVAAARLGAPVAMIGCVGADDFGCVVRAALAGAGVQVEHLRVDSHAATGTAQIVVDAQGENTIVIASGANTCLGFEEVVTAEAAWSEAGLVVLQLEVPLLTVAATVAQAARRAIPVLLNAAPMQPVPEELLAAVAWLVVNEVEAGQLVGGAVRTVEDAFAAGARLRRPGQHVLVTLGAQGAVWASDAGREHLRAPSVTTVDTTAAGDAFVGALAAGIVRGVPADKAVRTAVIAGSLACTKAGAIPSLPTATEVAEFGGRGSGGAVRQ